MSARTPLFVRIPAAEAERLDRAAFELGASKQDLIAGLVARYVDPGSPRALEALGALAGGPRRVTVDLPDEGLPVGRHEFRPAEPAEVLTLDEAAALLRVGAHVVRALAEAGKIPGRRLGGHWRFARRGLLEWLAASPGDGQSAATTPTGHETPVPPSPQ
jgi:excisionase family DNA binding protein